MATEEKRIGTDITDREPVQKALEEAGITTTSGTVYAIPKDGSKPELVQIRVLLINNKNYVVVGSTLTSGVMGTPNPKTYKLAPMGPQDAAMTTYATELKKAEGITWTNEAPKGGRRRRTRRKSRARKSRRSRK